MTTTGNSRTWLPAAGLCLLVLAAGCGGGGPAAAPNPTAPASGSQSGSSASGSSAPLAPTAAAPPPPSPSRPPSAGSSTPAAGQAPVPVESNPPGDIPDSLAFVAYRNRPGGYAFTYPEGWARRERGTSVTFTDKLNGIQADTAGAPAAPTVAAIRRQVLPRLQQTQPAFELKTVEPVTLPAGQGVRVVYRRNSAPDPVTGRQVRDEVESYLIARGGKQLRLDLFGPVGADNVDAYRMISRSLALA